METKLSDTHFIYKVRLIGVGEYIELALESNEYVHLNNYLINNSSLEEGLRKFCCSVSSEGVRGMIGEALEKYGKHIRYQFIGKFKADIEKKS